MMSHFIQIYAVCSLILSMTLLERNFLARLFLKKTSRYCHGPGVVSGGIVVVVHRLA